MTNYFPLFLMRKHLALWSSLEKDWSIYVITLLNSVDRHPPSAWLEVFRLASEAERVCYRRPVSLWKVWFLKVGSPRLLWRPHFPCQFRSRPCTHSSPLERLIAENVNSLSEYFMLLPVMSSLKDQGRMFSFLFKHPNTDVCKMTSNRTGENKMSCS